MRYKFAEIAKILETEIESQSTTGKLSIKQIVEVVYPKIMELHPGITQKGITRNFMEVILREYVTLIHPVYSNVK